MKTLLCLLVLLSTTVPTRADLPEAYAFIQQGDYTGALKALESETNPTGYKTKGNCYMALHDWTKAVECYKLIQPQSKDTETWIADCELAQDNPAPMQVLMQKHPEDLNLHYLAGRRYQWMLRFADAAKELKQVTTSEGCQRYILCSLSALDFTSALEYLPTFVAKYPDDIPNVVSGNLYRWKFKVPEVIKIVEAAQNGSLKLKTSLADCYVAVHDWPKATTVLQSIDSQFRDAKWYTVLSKCSWGQGKTDDAIWALGEAIKLAPDDLELKKSLLFYYRDCGKYEQMLTQTEVLLKAWPQNSDEWTLNKGWAYLDLGRYAEAIPVFKGVLASPQRWVIRGAWVSLGECMYKTGQGEQALLDLKAYYEWKSDLKIEYLLMYAQIMFHGPRDIPACLEKLNLILTTYQSDPLARDARNFKMMVLEADGRWTEAAVLEKTMTESMPVWNTWERAEMTKRTADSYFQAKKYKDAVGVYRGILESPGLSKDFRGAVTLQIALCQQAQGYLSSARGYLSTIVRLYPATSATDQAADLIKLWGALKGGN